MKRAELSSLDQSFRGAIAPIALVVLLPLHERNTLRNSYVTRLYYWKKCENVAEVCMIFFVSSERSFCIFLMYECTPFEQVLKTMYVIDKPIP